MCVRNREATEPIFDALPISEEDGDMVKELLCYPSLLASSIGKVEEFLMQCDADISSLQQLFVHNMPGIVTVLNVPFVGLVGSIEGSLCVSTTRQPTPCIQILVALCASSWCRCVLRSWHVGVPRRGQRWLRAACLSGFSCGQIEGITSRS